MADVHNPESPPAVRKIVCFKKPKPLHLRFRAVGRHGKDMEALRCGLGKGKNRKRFYRGGGVGTKR